MAKHETSLVNIGDSFAMELFKAYCIKTPPSDTQAWWYYREIQDMQDSILMFDTNMFEILAYCRNLESALEKAFEKAHITSNKTRQLFPQHI